MALNSTYRKSTYSGGQGACVAARTREGGVEMQDTKDPHGPTLRVPADAWARFAAAVPTR
jgi:hypothetical protein